MTVCFADVTQDKKGKNPAKCKELLDRLKGGVEFLTPMPERREDHLVIYFPRCVRPPFGESTSADRQELCRLFVDYMVLQHHSDLEWRGPICSIYAPHGDRSYPVVASETNEPVAKVRFVLDKDGKEVEGMEWRGVWEPGKEVPKTDEAEVVFEKR